MGSSSFGTSSLHVVNLPVNDITYFLQPTGRWSVIGFLMTFISFVFVSVARTLILWRSWTAIDWSNVQIGWGILNNFIANVPINPPNRFNVRGIRVWGLISINTFLAVWMYTCSKPARFNGESNNINRDWCVISGRHVPGSRPFFRSMFMWSSQFNNSNKFPTCNKPNIQIETINSAVPKLTFTVSNCAPSSTTISLFSWEFMWLFAKCLGGKLNTFSSSPLLLSTLRFFPFPMLISINFSIQPSTSTKRFVMTDVAFHVCDI